MKKSLRLGTETIEYELTRKRVKNLNLRIKPDGAVHVSAPYFVPQARIDSFILSHAERIVASLEKMRRNAESVRESCSSITLSGESVPVRTVSASRSGAVLRDGVVLLSLRDMDDSAEREKVLQKLIRELAIDRVTESSERIYPVFQAMGVQKPEIKFRKMKSRWGSCRYQKASLSFNTALAHVPAECIDYVVMHEYCHFIHPNHSPNFHALMTKLMPDWKTRKKTLEKYSSLL